LRKPDRDYQKLYDAIRAYKTFACVLESVWIIKTNDNPLDVVNNLSKHIDSNDYLFSSKISRDAAWTFNLPDNKQQWLNNNL
jgi:23S rRNA A1618 N6-methylase RlmF